ncbi:hypothetical protein AAZR23_20020 [Morganella sp. Je.2.23]|uniref:hypothetical protein n=1 Tax=Morganella sp. Je.2.23 TaxID=3142840 RepID=UPI003DA81ECB
MALMPQNRNAWHDDALFRSPYYQHIVSLQTDRHYMHPIRGGSAIAENNGKPQ